MPIRWGDSAALERLIAALLAAHPNFSPNYHAMSVYFGQGASYDALQSRFRVYRGMADDMLATTSRPQGTTPSRRKTGQPSTPRTNRGGVTKPRSSKRSQTLRPEQITPTKKGKVRNGTIISDAIVLDDEDETGEISFKNESSPRERKPKMQNLTANVNGAIKHEPAATIDLEPFIVEKNKELHPVTPLSTTNPYVDLEPDENRVSLLRENEVLDNGGLRDRELHELYSSFTECEQDFIF